MSRRAKPHQMHVSLSFDRDGVVYYRVDDPTRAKPVSVRVPRQDATKPACLTHNTTKCEHCTAVLLHLLHHPLPPLQPVGDQCQS